MSAIGPGDWVERDPAYVGGKNAIPRSQLKIFGAGIEFGKLYRVREMRLLRCPVDGHAWQGLRLDGIVFSVPGHPDAFVQAEAFRPIYRPKADFIEALKRPAPEQEPA